MNKTILFIVRSKKNIQIDLIKKVRFKKVRNY